jgi:outer membrane protein assembly factor BamB
LTPGTISGSYVAGYPKAISLTAAQTVPFVGIAYIKFGNDAAVLPTAPTISMSGDGTLAISITPSTTIAAGRYAGKVAVNVCSDPNCVNQLAGSPFQVPYDFTVDPAEGGVTALNLTGLSPLAGAPDWEMYQANASHTGFVPVTLSPAAFSARWSWVVPALQGKQPAVSSITTSGGRLFLATGLGSLSQAPFAVYAMNEADGKLAWSHDFGSAYDASVNPPAVSGGKVYVTAGSQQSTAMYSFDAATGAQLFRSTMSSQWEKYLAPTIFDTTVYTDGGSYGGMYAFDKTSGAQVFFVNNLTQYDGWTPAVDANYAYAYVGGALNVLDRRTGARIAQIADPTYQWNGYTNVGAPVLGVAGSVTTVNGGSPSANAIVNYNIGAQTVRWNVAGAYSGNPGYQGGTLFATNNNPFRLEARNEADGTLLWSWSPPAADTRFASDVIVTNNLIFVSTSTTTYAIDRTSHTAAWSYPAAGPLALSANGILYIDASPRVHAINLK